MLQRLPALTPPRQTEGSCQTPVRRGSLKTPTSATASASASELLQLRLGEAALDEEDEAARLDGAALDEAAGIDEGADLDEAYL